MLLINDYVAVIRANSHLRIAFISISFTPKIRYPGLMVTETKKKKKNNNFIGK